MTRDEYVKLPYPVYDKREEFETEIRPLLDKLHEECEKRGLGLFATIAYSSPGDGTFGVFVSGYYDAPTSPAQILSYMKLHEGDVGGAVDVLNSDAERYDNNFLKGTRH